MTTRRCLMFVRARAPMVGGTASAQVDLRAMAALRKAKDVEVERG